MAERLDDKAITEALRTMPGWEREDNALVQTFTFPAFLDGIAFVVRVAQAAEAANHHPDLDIRYTRVRCALSTHDAGGITAKDVELASKIGELLSA